MGELMKISIVKLPSIEFSQERQQEFSDVFFLTSSKKEFNSDQDKEDFKEKWTKFYFEQAQEHVYFALVGEKIVGYLTGHPDSKSCNQLYKINPTYCYFEEMFEKFPAHLHINCHPKFVGQGIGRDLVNNFCEDLKKQGSSGTHIITLPDAGNTRFYDKVGFKHRVMKRNLLFMGREI